MISQTFLPILNSTIGKITSPGKLGVPTPTKPFIADLFANGFSSILGLLTILGALYFLIQIVIAAYTILGSRGQIAKLDEGRERITYAVVGLAVVVAAYAITGLIVNLFGINVFNPFSNTSIFT